MQVSIWEEDTGIYVRVADNGVGFDTALLQLEQETPMGTEEHNHVALYNINRRILLLYGKPYGLTAKSEVGEGTEITMTLPFDTEEEGQGMDAWR